MNATTRIRTLFLNRQFKLAVLALSLAAILVAAPFMSGLSVKAVTIDELRDQAQQLEEEINANNDKLAEVQAERKSLENEIYSFDLEINTLQKQIEATNLEIKSLNLEIDKAQAELDRQNGMLTDAITELYKQGNVTTIELLASSNSYSDFISSQEYLSRIKSGIQDSVEKVKALKNELEVSKQKQQDLAKELKGKVDVLDMKRNEKAELLSATKGQETAYQERTKELVEQQKAVNRELLALSKVLVASGNGGYPYHEAACTVTGQVSGNCWNYEWVYQGSVIDPWGYYYRNCTSYVAWRSALNNHPVPTGLGNGGDWGYTAPAYGLGRGHTPQVGAFASFYTGGYGHVAYVEEVYNDGTIRISEYNFVADGEYSERIIPASQPTWYIYP